MQEQPQPNLLALTDTAKSRADGPERGDAARNRKKILACAHNLITNDGVDALTMDRLAHCAGVGKGTIFRRFGSRTGLLLALLDEAEKQLQHAFISGPPPLGPGAPPQERLDAFGAARLKFLESHGDIQLAAERDSTTAVSAAPRLLDHTHVTNLLRAAGVTHHPHLLAMSLVASLSAPLVLYQVRAQGVTFPELHDSWRFHIECLIRS
ncbi:TetR/AcrR family transcriptional regulator [Hoyosella rhizosphaerae]|uniref:TetR/AcrR family transcriptional regulator n=1 Tax=Hoyosella rhizosphaerae TaxID=1755582 RepID=UPI001E5BF10F|nr:TetR/AcrR family transcriptional regulator [Hoyosella rhizosphaerae]